MNGQTWSTEFSATLDSAALNGRIMLSAILELQNNILSFKLIAESFLLAKNYSVIQSQTFHTI